MLSIVSVVIRRRSWWGRSRKRRSRFPTMIQTKRSFTCASWTWWSGENQRMFVVVVVVVCCGFKSRWIKILTWRWFYFLTLIVSLCFRTLYCAKGNYDFGISRVIKSLEPYNKKVRRWILSTLTYFIYTGFQLHVSNALITVKFQSDVVDHLSAVKQPQQFRKYVLWLTLVWSQTAAETTSVLLWNQTKLSVCVCLCL